LTLFKANDILLSRQGEVKILKRFNLVKHYRAFSHQPEKIYKKLVENSADAIIIVDSEGRIKEWNESANALFGISKSSIIGRNIDSLKEPWGLELKNLYVSARSGKTISNFETARRVSNGILKEITYTLFLIKSQKEHIEAVGIIARDITENRNLIQQVQQSEKMAESGKIAAGIAHQFNTPLSSIILNAQILKVSSSHEKAIQAAELIYRQAKYCSMVIKELLNFVRASEPGHDVIDLNSIVSDVTSIISRDLEVKGIELLTDLSKKNCRISGNRNKMEQLLFNLVTNARDATPVGGKILIKTVTNNSTIELTVSDTGNGIKEEHLPQIFDPFFSTKESGKGTGLGLAVVKGIAEEHSGKINIKSASGKGTEFEIHFPKSSL
jgi:PAS domain S-box-containing protein